MKMMSSCLVFMLAITSSSEAQLDPSFYNETCPNLHSVVSQVIVNASQTDPRFFANLLSLHFHQCFGCEASVL
ncbi:hypothetical protein Ahy_B04g069831 [Arachis hypogaea]|uniref:peroxidase n=1 Tax=Arachis hypogaea TaxID=3818 RepID=A0A444ZDQ1_ARAHY|nr:hypothetical protein Ahy_B04g069831 [Arachis hypogaea]